MKKISMFLLVILITSFIIPASVSAASEDEVKLTVIHVNDAHGRTAAEPYISQMAADLKSRGENVLVLDAGDRLHGQTAVNLSKGESAVEIMNAVGYDAMITGNHDYNFGVDRLKELSGMMNFPLLAANVIDSNGQLLFKPYEIFKMDKITAGVFGIATPETLTKSDPRIVGGLIFTDPAETAAETVSVLKAEGCDIIIALVHLGDEEPTAPEHKSDALADIKGIDVIIDGHNHTLYENGRNIGNTLITQTDGHSQHIGIIEITVSGSAVSKTASVINIQETTLPADEAVTAVIEKWEKSVEDIISVVVGNTPVHLEGARELVRTEETNLANLLTDSMRHATGADFAFLTGGNIRASIEAGNITMGDVLNVLPFSNLLVTVELNGADIIKILEHGISKYPEETGQHIQVAGIMFKFDPDSQEGQRVVNVFMADGSIFDENKKYTVSTIDFLAAGGDGYEMLMNGLNLTYYGGDAEAFVDYLTTNPVIFSEPEGRVKIISTSVAEENPKTEENPETKVNNNSLKINITVCGVLLLCIASKKKENTVI